MSRFIIFSVLFLVVSFCSVCAQNSQDFGIWSGVKINQEIVNDFNFSLKGQLRMDGNANYFSSAFSDFSLNYKFNKYFAIRAGYRYTVRNNPNTHRAYIDLLPTYKIADTGLRLKLRLRSQFNTISDYTNQYSFILRSRLYLSFSPKGKFIKKFNFYTTGEVFYEFYDNNSLMNKWRFSAGMTYAFSKDIVLNLRYILQDEIGVKNPVMEHIFVMGLSVDLPDFGNSKKKKKKKKKKKNNDNSN